MFQINNIKLTNEEWKELNEILKNTYVPIRDENNKITNLSNLIPYDMMVEIVEEIRRKKAL